MTPANVMTASQPPGLLTPGPGLADQLGGLLGNPMFTMGLQLLAARQDGRINPYQAALHGIGQAQAFKGMQQDRKDRKRRAEQELEQARQELEQRMAAERGKQVGIIRYEKLLNEGNAPSAMDAHKAGIPMAVHEKNIAPFQVPEREIVEDAHGRKRYIDDGSYVFADVGAPMPDQAKIFDHEKALRAELRGLNKDFRTQEAAYGRIKTSAENPSPAGDLALIFNYMKLLDPGSTVRESEFENAAASGAYGERLQAAALRLKTGERLTPEMRKDFVSRSKALYKDAVSGRNVRAARYRTLSEAYGVNPDRIVISEPLYSLEEESAATELAPGTIDSGYLFKGGDPADPANWQKL